MKQLILMLGLLVMNIILNAQEPFQLKSIKSENGQSWLVIVNNDKPIDTLSSGIGYLIDYHIKSKDSISVISSYGDFYSYDQYSLSLETNNWSTDSVVLWGAPPFIHHPQKITYELQDFHTVIKIIDGERTVMNLQEIRDYDQKRRKRYGLLKN